MIAAARRDVGGQVDQERRQHNDPHRYIDVKDPAPARGLGDQRADKGAMIGEPAPKRGADETRETIDDPEQALPLCTFCRREHVGDQHKGQRNTDSSA